MSDLIKYNLRKNPFAHITPNFSFSNKRNMVWADMAKLKDKFEKIFKRLISRGEKQVVLNWGTWGGGKTFCALYYYNEHLENENIESIYIRLPKEGKTIDFNLQKEIFDFISFNKIKSKIQELKTLMAEDELLKYLTNIIKSEEYAKAILLIGNNSKATDDLIKHYMFNGLNKSELKKLDLARNIDSVNERAKFIAGIFSLFTYKDEDRLVLWIDEMEDLVHLNSKDSTKVSMFLRDLIDLLNRSVTIFFNFSLAENQRSTLEYLLGEALSRRIQNYIQFDSFDKENAFIYISELIMAHQIKRNESLFPLDKKMVNRIVDDIPPEKLTPGEVNKVFSELLNLALDEDSDNISIDLYNQYLSNVSAFS